MQDAWMERLSEYMDGDMDRTERASIEAHLEECAECAAVLADLKRVRTRAREFGAVPVPADLWPRIETAIAQGRTGTPHASPPSGPAGVTRIGSAHGGRFSFSLPELLAACLAVAIISGGTVFALVRHQAPASKAAPAIVARAPGFEPSRGAATERTSPTAGQEGVERGAEHGPAPSSAAVVPAVQANAGAAAATSPAETPHEEAISELRRALMSKRSQLDPATIRTLESNLAIIDLAIDQARRALAADSANTYVKEHLAETMRRKIQLLQRATMLASASTGVIR